MDCNSEPPRSCESQLKLSDKGARHHNYSHNSWTETSRRFLLTHIILAFATGRFVSKRAKWRWAKMRFTIFLFTKKTSEGSVFCNNARHRYFTICHNDNIKDYARLAYIYMFFNNICVIITMYYAYHACADFSSKRKKRLIVLFSSKYTRLKHVSRMHNV